MCSQMMEPEVTLTDVIRRHVEMGLAIIDAFSAEQRKELKRYSRLCSNNDKRHSKKAKKIGGGGSGGGGGGSGGHDDEVPSTIPFNTLSFLHKTLTKHFRVDERLEEEEEISQRPVAYLHELLRGSALHIPQLPKPERNPALEARCRRLKLEQEEKEYQSMVSDVNSSTLSTCADLASEYSKAVKTTSSALIVVVNVVLTVAAAFAFGFFAAKYSMPTPNLAAQSLVGVVLASVIAAADLYFLIKNGV